MMYLQLISQERFLCLEKIKTIGSTYMAASGLTPHNAAYPVSDDTDINQSDPNFDMSTTEQPTHLNNKDINA